MQEFKFASRKQYLFDLLSSINVKEDSHKPKCTSKFFNMSKFKWLTNLQKQLQLASSYVFCSMFFLKVCRHCEIFSTATLSFSLKQFNLHSNSAALILMLMLSSKIKVSYTILIHTLKSFVAELFYDKVF